jgi:hypothetical protein
MRQTLLQMKVSQCDIAGDLRSRRAAPVADRIKKYGTWNVLLETVQVHIILLSDLEPSPSGKPICVQACNRNGDGGGSNYTDCSLSEYTE